MSEISFQLLHHQSAAHVKRRALVQFGRLDIEDTFFTIRSLTTGHFHDEGKGIAFVEQAKLAFWFGKSAGIHEDPSLDEIAMDIGYHAANVSLRIRPAVVFILLLTGVDIGFNLVVVLEKITVIDRVYLPRFGTFDIRMAERELPDRRVERESIDPTAGGIDHHGRGAVDDVTGGHLFIAGLQEVFPGARLTFSADAAIDPEYRADGHIHIDVATAVQGIEKADVLGVVADLIIEDDEVIQLFAADTRTADAMP